MKERLRALLLELTALNGVSGAEQDVVRYMKRELARVSDSVTVDHMGNVFGVKSSGRPGPTMMLVAHSDEIGAMVTSVEKNGYLRFEKVGGTIEPLLIGRKVWVGKHLGVIGVKAGHLQTEKERAEVKNYRELYIDVGAKNDQEVKQMGIRVGTRVAYNSPIEFFTDSDRFVGKSVDDRLGCAILLELMRNVTPKAGTLVGVVSSQEEVGLRGAQVAAFKVNPTFALALDTMPSGDTPDIDFLRQLPVGIGMGPVFQVMTGYDYHGFLLAPSVEELLIGTAEEEGVPYQLATLSASNTDATAIHLQREGIPTGVVALPRRYSHSPVEVGDINDAVNAYRLLKAIVDKLSPDMDWSFVE